MPTGIAAWAAADVPILCFDTCSILDIVRDPTRDTARDHEARAALQLVEAMEQRRLIGLKQTCSATPTDQPLARQSRQRIGLQTRGRY